MYVCLGNVSVFLCVNVGVCVYVYVYVCECVCVCELAQYCAILATTSGQRDERRRRGTMKTTSARRVLF